MQLIVQDPVSALNPRRTVADIVAEPLRIWRSGNAKTQREKIGETLDSVGLDLKVVGARRPFEFSGGQCQRINIARALIMDPELLVCDEPVSALDVSIRAQIVQVLEEAKTRYGLTMIFVGHDLAVVKNVSDRIAVMYLGKLCEIAPSDALCASPLHPYTAALLESVLEPHQETTRREPFAQLEVEMPSPLRPPSGCRFRTRCPYATEVCALEEPGMVEIRPGHAVACHHPLGREADNPTAQGGRG
jgi:peptide/nickel transport system ATP-binding protein